MVSCVKELTVATSFDAVSALRQVGPARFEADLHPEWTIVGKPNGGYQLAVLARAAAALSGHPHVVAASAHYLRAPVPGLVTVEVDVLRSGRGASQLRARLGQDGEARVEALLTMSTLDPTGAAYWDAGLPGPGNLAWDACRRLVPRTPDGSRVPIMEQVEVRLDPECEGFIRGRPSGRGELRGWLALPDGEAFTPASLLFAVDAFPPATFDLEFTGWVPTLELTAYVRALPAPGPVRILQRAQLLGARRVDEACFVWDSTGRLLAQATQLAAIRLG